MTSNVQKPKISFLWRRGLNSIQELLESEEYKNLLATGPRGGRIFTLFPINNRFVDPESGTELLFCKDKAHLKERLVSKLGDGDILLPFHPGLRFNGRISAALLRQSAKENVKLLAYDINFKSGNEKKRLKAELTPWNLAVSAEFLKQNPDEILDFLIDYKKTRLPEFNQVRFLDETSIKLENHVVEKEIAIYLGDAPKPDELKEYLAESDYLLGYYVEKQPESGRREAVDALTFSLLERTDDLLSASDVAYKRLKEMEGLLEDEDWKGLEEASRIHSSENGNERLKIAASFYRTVALANLNEMESALGALQAAMELEPKNQTAHFLMAAIMLALGKTQDAASFLKAISTASPQDYHYLKLLAYAQYRSGDYISATKTLVYFLNVFDFDHRVLRFLLHVVYTNGDMENLKKFVNHIENYPPIPAEFPEKEWLLIMDLIDDSNGEQWVVDVGAEDGERAGMLLERGHRCLVIETADNSNLALERNLSGFEDRMISSDSKNALNEIINQNAIRDISLLGINAAGRELELLKQLDWSRFEHIGFISLRLDLEYPFMSTLYYLFGAAYQHGLAFQHPDEDMNSYGILKLEALENPPLSPVNGKTVNVLLSKEPLFTFEESLFFDKETVFPADMVKGRFLR